MDADVYQKARTQAHTLTRARTRTLERARTRTLTRAPALSLALALALSIAFALTLALALTACGNETPGEGDEATAQAGVASQNAAAAQGDPEGQDGGAAAQAAAPTAPPEPEASTSASASASASTPASTTATASASTPTLSATPMPSPAPPADSTPPPVPLRLEASEYPIVDGSTATIPLAAALRSAVTGMPMAEAEASIRHTKTSQSFFALARGEADLLLVYDPPESVISGLAENGTRFTMEPIGRDALVFIVNDRNPARSLTPGQLVGIYSGEITDWADVGAAAGPIAAFQRDSASGSQSMMDKLVMRGKPMADAPYDRIITEMGSLIDRVADFSNRENAIGYSVYYYYHNMYVVPGIRALDVSGVRCANATIRDGSYPFSQDFYAVIRESEPAGSNARKLFDLVTGPDGAALVEYAGYVSKYAQAGGAAGGAAGSVAGGLTGGEARDETGGEAGGGRQPAQVQEPGGGADGLALPSMIGCGNLFPVTVNGLVGFIDGAGNWVIAPYYDGYNGVYTVDDAGGGAKTQQGGAKEGTSAIHPAPPLYWNAYRYSRQINGTKDSTVQGVSRVLAPGGEVLFEHTSGSNLTVYQLYSDGSMSGSIESFNSVDGEQFPGEWRQIGISADGQTTTASLGFDSFTPCDAQGADRWVVTRGGFTHLIDRSGNVLTQQRYDSLIASFGDYFIFMLPGRQGVEVVGRDGAAQVTLPDVISLRPNGDGTLVYIDRESEFYGLMDAAFNRLTEPLYQNLSYLGDGVCIAGSQNRDSIIIDTAGRQVSKRGFEYLWPTHAYDDGHDGMPSILTGQTKEGREQGTGMEFVDISGRSIFHGMASGIAIDVFGGYAAIALEDVGDPDDYMERRVGLKSILADDGKSIASVSQIDARPWLIPPEYSYIQRWDGRFLLAESYARYSGREHWDEAPERGQYALFDSDRGEVTLWGDWEDLQLAGYADVSGGDGGGGGGSGTPRPMLNARTGARKGYIDETGSWVFSVSVFDTLSSGD